MWSNWSGGQQCRPRATIRPLDEAGVCAAVRRATEQEMRLRPLGAGHSFSPLATSDEIQLDVSALTGVVSTSPDRVRVRAGTTLGGLYAALAEFGLALPSQGDVDTQTVGGAVATGTHGSMHAVGSLSAQVRALRLVSGAARVSELRDADLDAARTSLGALGVVTEVELAVVPAFVLRLSQARSSLEEALAEEFLSAHRLAEFWVFPYADEVLTRWADEVTEEPEPRSGLRTFVGQRLVRGAAVGGGVALGRSVPRLVPAINRAATRLHGTGTATDLAHRVLVNNPVVRWEESEWALPRPALGAAVRELLGAITERELDVGFPLEVRVGPAESGWLHPAYGRATAWVAAHTAAGTDSEPLFRLVAEVLADHGGRPHWGKRHPWGAAEVSEAYPRLADFVAVRNRFDPARVFSNPHLERLLGT